MSTVFISYRRASTLVEARAVYERLSRELGPGQVFIDLDDMEPGVDFVEQTNQQLNGCRVLLALIEPGWAAARDSRGQRRLDRSNDFVRIEIATALRRGIRVMPILIGDAEMPEEETLPDDLKPLVRRQALALDFRRFDSEVARVVAAIRRNLGGAVPQAVPVAAAPVVQVPAPPSPAPSPSIPPPPPPSQPPQSGPDARATPAVAASPAGRRVQYRVLAVVAAGLALLGVLALLRGKEQERPASAPPAVAASAAAAAPSRQPGQMFRDCPECPEMVVIPAGSFMMGSPVSEPGRDDDEGPQRRVTLTAFAMGKTEVTQGQWKALMGGNPSSFSACGDECPVENVSWADAQEFIKRLNARTGKRYNLPSEVQWEYAARAGTTTAYHTGPSITQKQARFGLDVPVKVASFAANAFGLYDMHGNIKEWVQDCYDEQAYAGKARGDGSAYESSSCYARVLRGGSWVDDPRRLRASDRDYSQAGFRSTVFGFRVCRVPPID